MVGGLGGQVRAAVRGAAGNPGPEARQADPRGPLLPQGAGLPFVLTPPLGQHHHSEWCSEVTSLLYDMLIICVFFLI